MKICLIYPPRILENQWNFEKRANIPLGLAYLAAYLERKGHKVKIIDAIIEGINEIHEIDIEGQKRKYLGLDYETLRNKVEEFSPDLIGVSFPFTFFSISSYKLVEELAKLKKPIIAGGAHATVRPIECLNNKNIDFVAFGEAEETLLELVNLLERKSEDNKPNSKELSKILGLGFKIKNKIKINPRRLFIQNLDSLPFPAWHLLSMEKYQDLAKNKQTARKSNKRWMTVLTSRGCPFQCTFCSGREIMGLKWRYRSPENVLKEIETLVRKYKIKRIEFEDDNLTLNRNRIERICDLIIEKKINIEWATPNGVRADTLDFELLKKMKKAGLKQLFIAPESGDQRVVNQVIKKNLDLRKVEQVARDCKKLSIELYCFFMIGLIGETPKDMIRTMDFAFKLGKLGAKVYGDVIPMIPLYNTPQYEEAIKKNYLKVIPNKKFELSLLDLDALIETTQFKREDIKKIRQEWRKRARIFSITHLDGIKHYFFHSIELLRLKPLYLIKRIGQELVQYTKILIK
jgi:anaerobic magnesium-protoporphyrin IX monomethyl ester cyclase